jgi:hypothetical protein
MHHDENSVRGLEMDHADNDQAQARIDSAAVVAGVGVEQVEEEALSRKSLPIAAPGEVCLETAQIVGQKQEVVTAEAIAVTVIVMWVEGGQHENANAGGIAIDQLTGTPATAARVVLGALHKPSALALAVDPDLMNARTTLGRSRTDMVFVRERCDALRYDAMYAFIIITTCMAEVWTERSYQKGNNKAIRFWDEIILLLLQ